jgi:hypothetical protein
MPAHLKDDPPRLFLIRRWAAHVSSLFGGASIFLVGSAMVRHNPRDWDFRVCLTADAFAQRYAPASLLRSKAPQEIVSLLLQEEMGHAVRSRLIENWLLEMNRISGDAYYRWTGLYTEFQAQSVSMWRTFSGRPRWRVT